MPCLDRVCTAWTRLYRRLGAALAIAVIVVLFVNIALREIFGYPLVWANELALTLFVWTVFVGAGIAFAENARIRFCLFVDLIPENRRFLAEALVSYLGLVLLIGFWTMSIYMAWTFRHQRFTTMDVSVALEWLAAPCGMALAVIGWLRHGTWRLRAP